MRGPDRIRGRPGRAVALGVTVFVIGAAPLQAAAPPQDPTPVELPKPQEIDPAVDVSATTAAPPAPAAAAPAVPAAAAVAPAPPAIVPAREASGSGAAGAKSAAQDRLDLDTTQITGNRELPKVLYIVPWKRPDIGDLAGRPPNTLVDEVLAPVDRDVFQRENRYYDALQSQAAHPTTAIGRETQTAQPAAAGSTDAP